MYNVPYFEMKIQGKKKILHALNEGFFQQFDLGCEDVCATEKAGTSWKEIDVDGQTAVTATFVTVAKSLTDPSLTHEEKRTNTWYFASDGRINHVVLDWDSVDSLFPEGPWKPANPIAVAKSAVRTYDDGTLTRPNRFLLYHTEDMVMAFPTEMKQVPYHKKEYKGMTDILNAFTRGFFAEFDIGCDGLCDTMIDKGGKAQSWTKNDDGSVTATFITTAKSNTHTDTTMTETWTNIWEFADDGRIKKVTLDWADLGPLFPWMAKTKIERARTAVASFDDGSLLTETGFLKNHHPDMVMEFTRPMFNIPYFEMKTKGVEKILKSFNDGMFHYLDMGCEGECATKKGGDSWKMTTIGAPGCEPDTDAACYEVVEASFTTVVRPHEDKTRSMTESWKNTWYFHTDGRIKRVVFDWANMDQLFPLGPWMQVYPLEVTKAAVGTFDDGTIANEKEFLKYHTETVQFEWLRALEYVPNFKMKVVGHDAVLDTFVTGFWSMFDVECEGLCYKNKTTSWVKLNDGKVAASFDVIVRSKTNPHNTVREPWTAIWSFAEDGRINKLTFDWSANLDSLFTGPLVATPLEVAKKAVGTFDSGEITSEAIFLRYHHPDLVIEFDEHMHEVPHFEPKIQGMTALLKSFNEGFFAQFDLGCDKFCGTQRVRKWETVKRTARTGLTVNGPGVRGTFKTTARSVLEPERYQEELWSGTWYFHNDGRIIKFIAGWPSMDPLFKQEGKVGWKVNHPLEVAKAAVGSFDTGAFVSEFGFLKYHTPTAVFEFTRDMPNVPYFEKKVIGTAKVVRAATTGMFSQYDLGCDPTCSAKAVYYKNIEHPTRGKGVEAMFEATASSHKNLHAADIVYEIEENWINRWFFDESGRISYTELDWMDLGPLFPWNAMSRIERVKAAVATFDDGSIKKKGGFLKWHTPGTVLEFTADMPGVPYFNKEFVGMQSMLDAFNWGMFTQFDIGCDGKCATEKAGDTWKDIDGQGVEATFTTVAKSLDGTKTHSEVRTNRWYFDEDGRINRIIATWDTLDSLFPAGNWKLNDPIKVAVAAVGTFDDGIFHQKEGYLLYHTDEMVIEFAQDMKYVPFFKKQLVGYKEILHSVNEGMFTQFDLGCKGNCSNKAVSWEKVGNTVVGVFKTVARSLIDSQATMEETWTNTWEFAPDGRISKVTFDWPPLDPLFTMPLRISNIETAKRVCNTFDTGQIQTEAGFSHYHSKDLVVEFTLDMPRVPHFPVGRKYEGIAEVLRAFNIGLFTQVDFGCPPLEKDGSGGCLSQAKYWEHLDNGDVRAVFVTTISSKGNLNYQIEEHWMNTWSFGPDGRVNKLVFDWADLSPLFPGDKWNILESPLDVAIGSVTANENGFFITENNFDEYHDPDMVLEFEVDMPLVPLFPDKRIIEGKDDIIDAAKPGGLFHQWDLGCDGNCYNKSVSWTLIETEPHPTITSLQCHGTAVVALFETVFKSIDDPWLTLQETWQNTYYFNCFGPKTGKIKRVVLNWTSIE